MGLPGRCALALGLTLAVACARVDTFVCAESSDCKDGSFTGICQDSGYCSFGDSVCPTGQRYGESAPGELAGTCVEAEGTTTDVAGTTSGGGTTVVTLDGATLEDGSLETGPLDDTTTSSLDDTTSSTGQGLDDSTTAPDSMSTTMPGETDPEESSDTMEPPPACGGLGGMDECSVCAYEACCDEILVCSKSPECVCFANCTANGLSTDVCLLKCGPSPEHDALDVCIDVHCMNVCPGQAMP